MTPDTDMISRAEADRQTREAVAEATKLTVPVAAMDQHIKEAVAAALMEAAKACEINAKVQRKKLESLRGHLDDHEKGSLMGAVVASEQMAAAIRALIAQEEPLNG